MVVERPVAVKTARPGITRRPKHDQNEPSLGLDFEESARRTGTVDKADAQVDHHRPGHRTGSAGYWGILIDPKYGGERPLFGENACDLEFRCNNG
jgi:hypothetical protein